MYYINDLSYSNRIKWNFLSKNVRRPARVRGASFVVSLNEKKLAVKGISYVEQLQSKDMLSSAANFSEIGLSSMRDGTQDEGLQQQRNVLSRPNLATLNVLNDEIDRVIDSTAEQVRKTFETFLSKWAECPSAMHIGQTKQNNWYIAQQM